MYPNVNVEGVSVGGRRFGLEQLRTTMKRKVPEYETGDFGTPFARSLDDFVAEFIQSYCVPLACEGMSDKPILGLAEVDTLLLWI
jgi:hypothetical protein